jgi:5S rRNA maturation endonuclease (ribonuclease M5)
VARYTYRDPEGRPTYQVVRYEMQDPAHPAFGEKQFMQRAYLPDHPEAGKKGCPEGYVWGRSKHGIRSLWYRLPRVLNAVSNGELVFIVEGEKDVHTLEQFGLTATCSSGGAQKGLGKRWRQEMSDVLKGAQVVCLPDNDEAGQRFMEAVSEKLLTVACSVKLLFLSGVSEKGDVTDWVEAGHTRCELLDLVEQASALERQPDTLDELIQLVEENEEAEDVFRNIELLAAAEAAQYSRAKSRIKEATGINLNDLQREVRQARKRLEEEQQQAERRQRREELGNEDRSVITLGQRHSREVVDEACEALQTYNDPPCLFTRGGTAVHVRREEAGSAEVEEVSEPRFDDYLSRAANVVRSGSLQPADLPKRLLQRVMARADFPELKGLSEVPLLRPDGTVAIEPGYDTATQFLYHPAPSLTVPDIPTTPSEADVEDALGLIEEALCDFPFVDTASRANTLALALTPLVQPLLGEANVPLAILDATKAGTGKSLLAQIIALMGTGRMPAAMSAPSGDSEWRKQITAQLIRGARFILVDNVTGRLGSPSLERVLTSPLWSDRVLGASEQVEVPAQAVWVATGNNLRPKGDLVRRTYLIRMDAGLVNPWQCDGFRHSQPDWTLEHRGQLVAALLTLVRFWCAKGRPEPKVQSIGSFERWCQVIGGILEAAGVEGFLENLDALYDAATSEDHEWARLLQAIHAWAVRDSDHQEATFTARQLAQDVEAEYHADSVGYQSDEHLRSIVEALPEGLIIKLRRREPLAHTFGRMLSFRVDRRFEGGWFVEETKRGREGVLWRVACDDVTEEEGTTRPWDPHPSSYENGRSSDSPDSPNPSPHRHERGPSDAPF